MEIVWSESALYSYFRVVDYLLENWTHLELLAFEKNVDKLLEQITLNNDLCPQSKLFGYRKCLIDKHNSLVYDITNNTIVIVSITDNRSIHPF